MVYPHKWSPISYRSSAGQRKHAGQRPMDHATNQRNSSSKTALSFVLRRSGRYRCCLSSSPLDAESRPCSARCEVADGCWGAADSHCRRCADYRLYDGHCVPTCNASVLGLDVDDATTRSLYVANRTTHDEERHCRRCHPQCNGNCVGDVS